jgi:hypothetical protein
MIMRDILIVVLIILALTCMHVLLALEDPPEKAGLLLLLVGVAVGTSVVFVGGG